MKKNISLLLIAALLLPMIMLSGCQQLSESNPSTTPGTTATPQTTQGNTTPSTTVPPTTAQPTTATSATAPPETTVPPATEPPETTAPPTQPPETTVPATQPPETVPPTKAPLANPDEMIGSIYTRQQLADMDNTLRGYGCGRYGNPTRPSTPVNSQKAYGQYNATFIKEDTPTVYLTFDCGYEFANLTGSILDTLKEKGIKAVFFVTLHYCKTNPHFVQRMIDEGHIVGNHSANHYSMPTLSVDGMVHEIMALHNYVKEKFGYEMFLFRPPKGEHSVRSLALTQSLGYESVFWSFAYNDWETGNQPDVDQSLQLISSCAHNGAVFLLHAVSYTNATLLGDLIDQLQQKGYTIAPYPQPT